MRKTKKAHVDTYFCVGCGVCQNICPLKAIHVTQNIHAEVDINKCVGCSKCVKACPASTISLITVEEGLYEK